MKEEYIKLLQSTNRAGMSDLIKYLEQIKFYDSPASTKFHGNYEGGLLEHSMNVFVLFSKHLNDFKIDFPEDSRIICSLLHDICKAGLYIKNGNSWKFNSNLGCEGHGRLSIKRIKNFINLTPLEEEIIKYHMGAYSTFEANDYGEYDLKLVMNIYNKNKLAKLFHFSDDMASQFIEKNV